MSSVAQGYSSAGRVPVSKTVGRGFESSCPCQRKIRVRKNADFSLYYSLFIIHHSLFIRPTRGFLMKNE